MCISFAMDTPISWYAPGSRRWGRETHDDDQPKEREKVPGVREGSDLSGSGDLTYERTVFDRYRIYTSSRSFLRCFLCRWIFYGQRCLRTGPWDAATFLFSLDYRGKEQNSHFRCFSCCRLILARVRNCRSNGTGSSSVCESDESTLRRIIIVNDSNYQKSILNLI